MAVRNPGLAKSATSLPAVLTGELLRPAALLPEQQEGGFRASLIPEQRLMVAVLEQAVDCVRKHRAAEGPQEKRLYREAVQWMRSERSDWPFSFLRLCDVLGLDAGGVRRALQLTGSTAVAKSIPRKSSGDTALGPLRK